MQSGQITPMFIFIEYYRVNSKELSKYFDHCDETKLHPD